MPRNKSTIENIKQKAIYNTALHIMIAFTATLFLISSYYFGKSETGSYFYLAALLIAIFGLTYLIKTKKTIVLFWVCSISGTILSHLSLNFAHETPHYVDFLWIISCCLLAFWGIGKKVGLAFVFINAIGAAVFVLFSLKTHVDVLTTINSDIIFVTIVEITLAMFILGYLLYQFFNVQKLTQLEIEKINRNLELNNRQFSDKVDENVTLVKEIHHRIKNNLQIIISLLRLQQSELDNSEAKVQFSEAINRILVMSSIHQRLYGEKDLNDIDLNSYIEDLTIELKSAYLPDQPIDVDFDIQLKQLDLRNIVPFGLLLNELISNSLKYAFKNKKDGKIEMKIQSLSENKYHFSYADNGLWQNAKENGFGLELISILTEQLNGHKDVEKDDLGTRYNFELEILGIEEHV